MLFRWSAYIYTLSLVFTKRDKDVLKFEKFCFSEWSSHGAKRMGLIEYTKDNSPLYYYLQSYFQKHIDMMYRYSLDNWVINIPKQAMIRAEL